MFYQEKKITELICCPICNNIYQDPRILSCGETICAHCILRLLNKDSTGLTCKFCNEFHQIPKNDFTINQRISKLISMRPKEVYRGKSIQNFKSDLDTIKEKMDALGADMNQGGDKIREYCEFIRNDVDLVTESWIESIQKFRDEFLKKIEMYEQECLVNYENFSKNDKSIRLFLDEAKVFHEKWTEYLEQFAIDKSEVLKASNEAKVLLENLETKRKDLKCKIFNGKLLKFEIDERKFTSQIVGKFKYQNLGKLNFDQLTEARLLPLKNKLTDFNARFKIAVEFFQNGTFIIGHQTSTNNVNMVALDKSGNVLRQKNSIIPIPNTSSLVYNLKLVKLSNRLALYIWYFNINFGHRFCLVSYDDNSNLKTKIFLDYPVNGFAAFADFLYLLSIQNGINKLSIYDSNLENTRNIGQKQPNCPFFFPLTLTKLAVNENHFFILDNNSEIKLMNRNDGLIVSSFKIKSNDFSIYLDQHILSYDGQAKRLYSYSFSGKLENEHMLDFLTENNQLIGISDDEFIFYDSIQVSLNLLII
jgi:hypothetical protein